MKYISLNLPSKNSFYRYKIKNNFQESFSCEIVGDFSTSVVKLINPIATFHFRFDCPKYDTVTVLLVNLFRISFSAIYLLDLFCRQTEIERKNGIYYSRLQ